MRWVFTPHLMPVNGPLLAAGINSCITSSSVMRVHCNDNDDSDGDDDVVSCTSSSATSSLSSFSSSGWCWSSNNTSFSFSFSCFRSIRLWFLASFRFCLRSLCVVGVEEGGEEVAEILCFLTNLQNASRVYEQKNISGTVLHQKVNQTLRLNNFTCKMRER